jgi:predicted RNA-binding Zn-ribbon protein involved in translation (DUF1610 family)
VTIIIGGRVIKGKGKNVTFTCPKCGPARGTHYRPWLWFTLYYVPIFPLGRAEPHDFVKCDQCQETWKPVVLDPLKLADYSKQLQDCQRHVPGDGYCPICGAIW